MKTILLKSYDQLDSPRPGGPLRVISRLPRGGAELNTPTISVKTVSVGEEHYDRVHGGSTLTPDRLIIAAPGDTFKVRTTGWSEGKCYYLDTARVTQLINEALSDDLAGSASASIEFWSTSLPVRATTLGTATTRLRARADAPWQDFLEAALAETWAELYTSAERLPHRRALAKNELAARLYTAAAFILDTLDQQITLRQIAEAACLSEFHLIRSFAALYGDPPMRYRQNLRLDQARDALAAGQRPTDLAAALGFSTVAAFSKAYLRRHGHRPSTDFIRATA